MPLSKIEKDEILLNAQKWFEESIAKNHILNTEKLEDPAQFNINPFLAIYLANFLTGNSDKKSIAKALIYPRVLGTSITTSFGTNIQKFANDVLGAFGSTTSGIDIEFKDQKDGVYKYCQLKSGPNTINRDDVVTIANHLKSALRLGKTNALKLKQEQMIVGLIYGEASELNAHYRSIEKNHNFEVYAGKEFWWRLTGEEDFYVELAHSIGSVAKNANYQDELNEVIDKLAENL